MIVFGSTVRGDTANLGSDFDVLVVLSDDVGGEPVENDLLVSNFLN